MQITRAQLVDTLENDWGTYVDRFASLTPQDQAACLSRQGYARFGDLLAHVIAWWEECNRALQAMLDDPSFITPEYDVDAFNAQAVQRFQKSAEPAVVQAFEAQRHALLALVANLPEDALHDPGIAGRLQVEVIGHMEEHRLSG